MNTRIRYIYYNFILQILLFVLVFSGDLITKTICLLNLRGTPGIVLIDQVISLHYVENTGAAFGIFKNGSVFFTIICSIVLIVIIFVYIGIFSGLKKYCTGRSDTDINTVTFRNMVFLEYILCVLAAGSAGNILDRILHGYVIDFIRIDFISFPVFNMADIYITVSMIILLIFFIFIYKEDKDFHIFRK